MIVIMSVAVVALIFYGLTCTVLAAALFLYLDDMNLETDTETMRKYTSKAIKKLFGKL